MLASYLSAVQISLLLKPHACFVNRNNVLLLHITQPSVSVGTNFHELIRLVNSSPERLMEDFDDYLSWSESI